MGRLRIDYKVVYKGSFLLSCWGYLRDRVLRGSGAYNVA